MLPAKAGPDRLADLKGLFLGHSHVYINYANTRKACERLGWRIDLQKLKNLLDSVGTVKSAGFYFGTIVGDTKSSGFMSRVRKTGFQVRTKPVKFINIPIDVSSISAQSPPRLFSQ